MFFIGRVYMRTTLARTLTHTNFSPQKYSFSRKYTNFLAKKAQKSTFFHHFCPFLLFLLCKMPLFASLSRFIQKHKNSLHCCKLFLRSCCRTRLEPSHIAEVHAVREEFVLRIHSQAEFHSSGIVQLVGVLEEQMTAF